MLKILKKKRQERQINRNRTDKAIASEIYLQDQAMHSTAMGTGNTSEQHIVVSLTSFAARIDTLYLTIESLFQQWLKADAIILWLSTDNFPGGWQDLPASLIKQCERGLEIVFIDGDIGPYKKIIPALQRFPESLIITVDDDLIYPADLIDHLYRQYLKTPTVIQCNRAHHISFDRSGKVRPYHLWEAPVTTDIAAKAVFPTGNAGVLYFPGCFHSDVTNEALFMRLAPNADDVWLKAMSLLNQIDCQITPCSRPWRARFLSIQDLRSPSLTSQNKALSGGNDDKLQAVFNHYGLWQQFQ